MLNRICNRCAGTGRTASGENYCPYCGKEAVDRPRTVVLEKNEDVMYIPPQYEGCVFNLDKFKNRYRGQCHTQDFQEHCRRLEDTLRIVQRGGVPSETQFFYSPQGNQKTEFAYSMIQAALDKGLTTTPLLDTLQIQELINATLDDTRLFDLTLNDVLYAEILVLLIPTAYPNVKESRISYEMKEVLKSTLNEYTYRALQDELTPKRAYNAITQVLQYIVKTRERLGKTTTIISSRPLNSLYDPFYDVYTLNMTYVPYRRRY